MSGCRVPWWDQPGGAFRNILLVCGFALIFALLPFCPSHGGTSRVVPLVMSMMTEVVFRLFILTVLLRWRFLLKNFLLLI